MIAYLKRLGAWFIWQEKKLVKSATLNLSYLMASAPVWAPEVQNHVADIAHAVPPTWWAALQSPFMTLLGALVWVCRMRTMMPPKPAPPAGT